MGAKKHKSKGEFPTLQDAAAHLRKEHALKPSVDRRGRYFDLVAAGSVGPLLVRFYWYAVDGTPLLTVEVRNVAWVRYGEEALHAVQRDNIRLPFGAWHLDDDGEIFYRCQTVLSKNDWRDQLKFLLIAPLSIAQGMQAALGDSDDDAPDEGVGSPHESHGKGLRGVTLN